MNFIKKIILNRNFILILAVMLGLTVGEGAHFTKHYTFYVLAIVMTFSTTGISTKAMFPLKTMLKPMIMGAILNYVFFGIVIIGLAYLLMPTPKLFVGFIVIASTPPGVAVIPFSHILNGDLKYGIVGTLGAFLASLIFAPLIVGLFTNIEGGINPMDLFWAMIKLVLIPLIISRVLLFQSIKPTVEKIRGRIVDWGFALIIFTAVGLNRQVFFSNFDVLALVALTLFLSLFGLGFIYEKIAPALGISTPVATTQKLLLTIKSSGFAVVTALTLFGEETAIPSAVLAVMVLAYLLFLNIRNDIQPKKERKHQ